MSTHVSRGIGMDSIDLAMDYGLGMYCVGKKISRFACTHNHMIWYICKKQEEISEILQKAESSTCISWTSIINWYITLYNWVIYTNNKHFNTSRIESPGCTLQFLQAFAAQLLRHRSRAEGQKRRGVAKSMPWASGCSNWMAFLWFVGIKLNNQLVMVNNLTSYIKWFITSHYSNHQIYNGYTVCIIIITS